MVLLYSFHCFHFIGYSMSSSYSSHIIVFSSSYLWSYWILSYLEALFYSWSTSSILLVFGLVDIIIRFKDGHMINTCQTHVCHMLSTCTTVHYCAMLCAQPFLLYYSFLSFNLYSLFILLTNKVSTHAALCAALDWVLPGVIVCPSILASLELTHMASGKCFGLNPACAAHSLAWGVSPSVNL